MIEEALRFIGFAVVVVGTAVAALHAVLRKRDPRAAIAWVSFVLLVPGFGAVAYALLGVNRLRRRAASLRPPAPHERLEDGAASHVVAALGQSGAHLDALARATGRVVGRPLVGGNELAILEGGDAAFPAMLAAIDAARRSIAFSTYIFDNDEVGAFFVDAFARARARGAEVRVLVDAVGFRYSFPPASRALKRAGVPYAVFMPTSAPWRAPWANLRNHRKILVVDGALGFTGGMNIRDEHLLSRGGENATDDVHFRVRGPIVAQLADVFRDDWAFAAKEHLGGDAWAAPSPAPAGRTWARAIEDGPEDGTDPLRWTLLSALACARRDVKIATPYFVPDQGLIAALATAALRGVQIDIVLPQKSNIPMVEWAQTALLWQTLEHGCRVHLSPRPFDHAKLMIVDDAWALVGSANWDARSLRLNFELDVECYDQTFAGEVGAAIDRRIARARKVSLDDVNARSFLVKTRDGLARLLTPYL